MTLSTETILQVEKDIAQLYEEHERNIGKMEQSIEDAITQHQQKCAEALSVYRKEKQEEMTKAIEHLRAEELAKQESAIEQLNVSIANQKDELISKITKEVLARYGGIENA
ncbi:hypothetical protein KG089_02385 [Carnobacteriaceae bacterium zg-ZUI252]|nr:hypothetical protein [Carnobacteriaceae bacterium zg-ZUI252]MBS4770219.1 hypothetical protein [Carnobacteriaceae bacterium zg-ZUI240]QTU83423.1 hypothetical protein J7S27_02575 [Carnobacteriaceae bacterium zg-C25]